MNYLSIFKRLLFGLFSGGEYYTAKPLGANADATSSYNDATKINIIGLSFLFTKYDIESIEHIPTTGNFKYYKTTNSFTVSGTLGNQVITIAGADFGASDTFVATFTGEKKGYNSANNAQITEVTNPAWSRYGNALIARVTNEANATTDRYFSMNGYNRYSVQIKVGAAVDTFKGTIHHSNDENSIVDSAKDYQNTTQYGHGISTAAATPAGATGYVADAITYLLPGANVQTVKIETVTAGGNDDMDYEIIVYRWFE